MIHAAIKDQIVKELDNLPIELQQRVVNFAHALVESKPKGVAGSELLRFAGTIDPDDLHDMEQAIEEGCERVDLNEW